MNPARGIAVIGIAGRFPGAADVDEFWRNIVHGVESIFVRQPKDYDPSTVDSLSMTERPRYVAAAAAVDGVEYFDADFFGIVPGEAVLLDPQHRMFLECAWTALENAGHDPLRLGGAVGVFAGCSANGYASLVLGQPTDSPPPALHVHLCTDKDYLATRVSYQLNLRGPSVAVQTACSTSLVAVHLACQSLLNGECDFALAGGVSLSLMGGGYVHQPGGILSPDGHCRAFDRHANGTVPGSGLGVVVLRRLEQATTGRDSILAVIRGSAVNNDGSSKVGFAAPSVEGQARVIAEALAVAGIESTSISYVEGHGTGTPLGDPIELAALADVFRSPAGRRSLCALGSVKTNIGHLDAAAGIAGLIKTIQALRHRTIPPNLHFSDLNPHTGMAGGLFSIPTQATTWTPDDGAPRRAGVSSFGMGGTNAHVILEEGPASPVDASVEWDLLVLSAKHQKALEQMCVGLADRLDRDATPHSSPTPGRLSLGDVAYTLQVGRSAFRHRAVVVARGLADASAALRSAQLRIQQQPSANPRIIFAFPGQGTTHGYVGRELYRTQSVFRAAVNACSESLGGRAGVDPRALISAKTLVRNDARPPEDTATSQPALFVFQYALAKLWMSWGVCPAAVIGHSLGEYVAACVAGVFSLDAALGLVTARGALMQEIPNGAMLAVHLTEAEIAAAIPPDLCLAAVNAPAMCVVSGPEPAVITFGAHLNRQGVHTRRLQTSRAFHHKSLGSIRTAFEECVRRARPGAPSLPMASGVTGEWLTVDQTTNPAYWGDHLLATVRFADGLRTVLQDPASVLLEVGRGRTLTGLARACVFDDSDRLAIASLTSIESDGVDRRQLLHAVGELWLAGAEIEWDALRDGRNLRRVPLPTYNFTRERYWPDSNPSGADASAAPTADPVLAIRDISATSPVNDGSNQPGLTEDLVRLVAPLVGAATSDISADANLFDLGFDARTYLRAAAAIEERFGVPMDVRSLMDGLSSVDRLTAYIAGQRPGTGGDSPSGALLATTSPIVAPVDARSPTQVPSAATVGVLPRLISQQLDIMDRQLQLLNASDRVRGRDLQGEAGPRMEDGMRATPDQSSP